MALEMVLGLTIAVHADIRLGRRRAGKTRKFLNLFYHQHKCRSAICLIPDQCRALRRCWDLRAICMWYTCRRRLRGAQPLRDLLP